MSSVPSNAAATAGAGTNEVPEQNTAPTTNAPAVPEANGQPDTSAHLVAFFSNYPEFTYDPTQPVLSELERMKRQFNWGNAKYRSASVRGKFLDALVLQFELTYGTDPNDLASWQKLLRAMGETNIPDELSKCKKVGNPVEAWALADKAEQLVKTIQVNLFDLIDMPNTGQPAKLFDTEKQLSKYSKRTDKIFPREKARASGLLKCLLREILGGHRGGKSKAKTT